jgi:hypothetical protein
MLISNPVKKLKKFLPKKVITRAILSIMRKKLQFRLPFLKICYADFSTVVKQRKVP